MSMLRTKTTRTQAARPQLLALLGVLRDLAVADPELVEMLVTTTALEDVGDDFVSIGDHTRGHDGSARARRPSDARLGAIADRWIDDVIATNAETERARRTQAQSGSGLGVHPEADRVPASTRQKIVRLVSTLLDFEDSDPLTARGVFLELETGGPRTHAEIEPWADEMIAKEQRYRARRAAELAAELAPKPTTSRKRRRAKDAAAAPTANRVARRPRSNRSSR